MITSLSPAGVARIKRYEACSLTPYKDVADLWTIGWGHLIGAGEAHLHQAITQDQADALLEIDLKRFVEGVVALLEVEVTQEQFDSVTSFSFNCGLEALRTSTFLKRVNGGAPNADIRAALRLWNKARVNGVLTPVAGLTNRRIDEGQAWP